MSGGKPERIGPKIYVCRAVSGTRKNERRGARSGQLRSGRGAVSGDQRNWL